MFKEANKDDLCQVSLTGIRSLVLLGLLIDRPLSLEDIRKEFIKFNIMEDDNSNDIIRIDLNTLRSMGCEISRADKRTDNKFVLTEHPFKIDVTEEEVGILKRAFNRLKPTLNTESVIKYDSLFRKLAENVSDSCVKEILLGLSPIKHYDLAIINDLQEVCKTNKTINFIYKSPASDKEIEKNIEAKEVLFKNDKVYLCGFDLDLKKVVTLNIDRIKKIISCKQSEDNNTIEKVQVKFKLKQFNVQGLQEGEKIIDGDLEKGFWVEGSYYNEFLAYQRILSFGADCTVIEPEDFKDGVIKRLEKMKEIYNG